VRDIDGEATTVTGSEPDEGPARPPRPALIELSGALLIVAGALGLFGALLDPSRPAGLELLALLTIALNIIQIVVGVLVRYGRFWLLDVNYVAILGFLDLSGAGASSLALLLGLIELGVVAVLFMYRSWFDGRWAPRA